MSSTELLCNIQLYSDRLCKRIPILCT